METTPEETKGVIIVPSSLDKPLTALIAAAVESIVCIGPCSARVTLDTIEDLREAKLESIITRAQEILQKWVSAPTLEQLTSRLRGRLEEQ